MCLKENGHQNKITKLHFDIVSSLNFGLVPLRLGLLIRPTPHYERKDKKGVL